MLDHKTGDKVDPSQEARTLAALILQGFEGYTMAPNNSQEALVTLIQSSLDAYAAAQKPEVGVISKYAIRKEKRLKLLAPLYYGHDRRSCYGNGHVFKLDQEGESYFVPGIRYLDEKIKIDVPFELFEIDYDPLIDFVDDFDINGWLEHDGEDYYVPQRNLIQIADEIRSMLNEEVQLIATRDAALAQKVRDEYEPYRLALLPYATCMAVADLAIETRPYIILEGDPSTPATSTVQVFFTKEDIREEAVRPYRTLLSKAAGLISRRDGLRSLDDWAAEALALLSSQPPAPAIEVAAYLEAPAGGDIDE